MMTEEELYLFVKKLDPSWLDAGTVFLDELSKIINSESVVLDIGCGRDTFGESVYKIARRRVGIDLEEYAKENTTMDEVHVLHPNDKLPFENESFDIVTAQWVFEHIDLPDQFSEELLRVLKPGGAIIFMTPNSRSPFVILTRALPTWIKARLRSKVLGFAHDETFPTFYKLNDESAIQKYFIIDSRTRPSPNGHGMPCPYERETRMHFVDCYGYYRFSKIIVFLAFVFFKILNKISSKRQHHLVGIVKKA